MPYIPGELLALLAGGRVAQKFLSREDKKNFDYIPHMRRLLIQEGWEDDFNAFRRENRNYGEYKALKKFFTPERLSYALEHEKKREESNKRLGQEMKKRYILSRIYAYPYEDFLFSLYAPFAKYNDYEKKWELPPIHHLPEGFVISKIATEYQLSQEEATTLFNELVDKWCIHYNNIGHYCELGLALTKYAGIVSANDMSINTWIEKNGQPISKEQLLLEAEPYQVKTQHSQHDDFFGSW